MAIMMVTNSFLKIFKFQNILEIFLTLRKFMKHFERFENLWKQKHYAASSTPHISMTSTGRSSLFSPLEQWDSHFTKVILHGCINDIAQLWFHHGGWFPVPASWAMAFPLYKGYIARLYEWYCTAVAYQSIEITPICWLHDGIWPIGLEIAQYVYNT